MNKCNKILICILLSIIGGSLFAQDYSVSLLPFNTDYYDEFSPVYYKGDIVFCSNKKNTIFISSSDEKKNLPLLDIYRVEESSKEGWGKPEIFSDEFKSRFNEGPATFSGRGSEIYFTRNIDNKKKLGNSIPKNNRLGIYYSKYTRRYDSWSAPTPFRYNNPEFNYAHPSLSEDDNYLYFVSDKLLHDGNDLITFDGNGEATFHGAIDNNGLLHIENTSNINGLDAVLELVGRRDNSTTSLNSRIEFKNYDQHLTTNPTNFFGVITGQTNDAVNNFGDMVFYSSSDGLTLSESMRLTSTDSVVVASGKLFHVKGDGNVTGTPTIDSRIDGTVVFGGENGSDKSWTNSDGVVIPVITDNAIASSLYADYSVWCTTGMVAYDFAIVSADEWADYVFNENYKLPKLVDVENYIKNNGHLQDMPSAEEVAEKGYSMGKMDKELLKKVEELTLYTIDQEKQINELKTMLNRLLKEHKTSKD